MVKKVERESPIRVARRLAGYTQVDVARRLKVTQQAVGTWETGKASPNGLVLAKLSRLYKTPTDALLGLDANRYFKLEKRIKSLEQQLAAATENKI